MRNMATDRELEVWLSEKENAMVEDIAALVEIPSISGESEGSAPYGRSGGTFKDIGNRKQMGLFLPLF